MQPHPTITELHHNKIGALDTLTVKADGYRAVVLLQGAQLIHFMTLEDEATELSDNWLWVSEHAEYKLGQAVRGGVPICWPVFGQFIANPQAVQNSFQDCPFELNQHGYARIQDFELDSFELYDTNNENNDKPCPSLQLILTLNQSDKDAPHLDLKVKFIFSQHGFNITLITQNNTDKPITFSQALHTYLPTDDITQTTITGFDGVTYSDTLTTDGTTGEWQTKTQQGDIRFTGEVDRIYHGAPDIRLNTPAHRYQLQAHGSNSTVVWNPWRDKAKTISQMDATDYQRMLCIETANAHLDVVELGVGEAWEMGMRLHRSKLG